MISFENSPSSEQNWNQQHPVQAEPVSRYDYRHLTMMTHTFWQADLCMGGSAEIVFPKYTLSEKKNDILIIPPGVSHKFHYTSLTEKFCCYSFKFNLENWTPEEKYIPKLISGQEQESVRETSLECVSHHRKISIGIQKKYQLLSYNTIDIIC